MPADIPSIAVPAHHTEGRDDEDMRAINALLARAADDQPRAAAPTHKIHASLLPHILGRGGGGLAADGTTIIKTIVPALADSPRIVGRAPPARPARMHHTAAMYVSSVWKTPIRWTLPQSAPRAPQTRDLRQDPVRKAIVTAFQDLAGTSPTL